MTAFILTLLAGCIIVGIHVWNDARGDNKKFNDLLVLTGLAILFASALKLFLDVDFLRSLALMAGIHELFFNYIIVFYLRKKGVIKASAKVFEYTGSKGIDKYFWSRVSPVVRVVVRVAVFGLALWYYTTG